MYPLEYAPLAVEKMVIGSILVFATSGLVGLAVARLQRIYQITNGWAWLIAILAILSLLAPQVFFQLPERMAPVVVPYMWMFSVLSVAVSALFWALCLFTLCGYKVTDLFKRR
ncbi:hypothetical protein ACTMQ1_26615 [Pseudomonas syringae pv. aptata]|uniref:hypothetical protein n=1 Tax=Pseudomonas syringae TaxID=317 RepID=UPI003F8978B1